MALERASSAVVASGAARHASEVVITHGAAEALLLACAITLKPGDHALLAPAYGGLIAAPAAVGAMVSDVPVWRSGDTGVNVDGLHEGLIDRPTTVLVNRPTTRRVE